MIVASVDVNRFAPTEGLPKLYFMPTIVLFPAEVSQSEKMAINYNYLYPGTLAGDQLVWITETFAVYVQSHR